MIRRLSTGLAMLLVMLATMQAARADDPQKPWFSGKTKVYTDTFNGYKIAVPEEMEQKDKGVSTYWVAQPNGNAAVSVHVNVTPMTGVPSSVLYETNLKTKKSDRNCKDVVAIPMPKLGKKVVYALRYREADHKDGSADAKEPGDIHRWFLMVFGQDRQYQVLLSGPYSAFTEKKVQAAFEATIKSFGILPVK